MDEEILQKRLSRFLVKDVFHTISEEDILQKKGGEWWHKGVPLTKGQVELLKKEAVSFSKMSISKILIAEFRDFGKKAHNKAVTESDIIVSNLLGYFAD